MIDILIVLAIVLSLALIVLVTIQPRQNQLFSMDATSNIGKPSYWQSNTLVKVLLSIFGKESRNLMMQSRITKPTIETMIKTVILGK